MQALIRPAWGRSLKKLYGVKAYKEDNDHVSHCINHANIDAY